MGRDIISETGQTEWVVSIHAPAWGATVLLRGIQRSGRGFNPRARMGRDVTLPDQVTVITSFNPRARMGRDTYEVAET